MATLLLNPIAFSIGSLSVHWYGLILGLGALAGLMVAIREGRRFGISPEFFMDMLLLGVPSAIIGARIYFVAFKWDDYKDHLVDVFKIWNGGIAIYGALIGAIICAIIYFRYRGYDFWRIADICAPGLLTGQMIGRWGNYVNQEAYGGPVDESFLRENLHLPNFIVDQMNVQGVYHHPTFLYESLWSLVGIIILFILRRQRFLRSAELFLSYFIWYSIGRFFIEGLRTDSLAFIGPNWLASFMNGLWKPMEWMGFEHGALDSAYGNVRISQLLAILIIIAAIVIIIVRRTTGKDKAHYLDPIYSTKASHDNMPESEAVTAEHALSENREEARPEPASIHDTEDAEDDKKE